MTSLTHSFARPDGSGVPTDPSRPGSRVEPAQLAVLILNADPVTLASLQLTLEFEGFCVRSTALLSTASDWMKREEFGVIVADFEIINPAQGDFLLRCATLQPQGAIVALTSVFLVATAMPLVSSGAIFGFVAKPWLREELLATVQAGVTSAATRRDNLSLRRELRDLSEKAAQLNLQVEALGADLAHKLARLKLLGREQQRELTHSLQFCRRLLLACNPALAARSHRVVGLVQRLAQRENFAPEASRRLILSAGLCDLGLVGVDPALLVRLSQRVESATADERSGYENHPLLSQNLAGYFDAAVEIGEIVSCHHECFDGTGFPEGRRGETIPWLARCLAVAVYLVETDLPYPESLQDLEAKSGRTLDPAAVRLFLNAPHLLAPSEQFVELALDHPALTSKLASVAYGLNPPSQPASKTTAPAATENQAATQATRVGQTLLTSA